MKIIIGGRASGKTNALKDWVLEAVDDVGLGVDGEIHIAVVRTQEDRTNMLAALSAARPGIDFPGHTVITYQTIDTYGLRGRNNFRFGLDDYEGLVDQKTTLMALAPMGIGMITVNSPVDLAGHDVHLLGVDELPTYGDFPMNVSESLTPSGGIS